MNKNKLKNIIELVVRKEVKKQLSEIFINEKEEIKLESINLGAAKNQDFDEKIQGKVTFYDNEKGFGFIKNITSQESYFFHFSECKDTLAQGDKVEFDTVRGEKGLNAVKINKL